MQMVCEQLSWQAENHLQQCYLIQIQMYEFSKNDTIYRLSVKISKIRLRSLQMTLTELFCCQLSERFLGEMAERQGDSVKTGTKGSQKTYFSRYTLNLQFHTKGKSSTQDEFTSTTINFNHITKQLVV